MSTPPLKIVVCGGGNGAHVFSTLAATRANTDVSVLTIFEDEAERWTKSMKDGVMVSFTAASNQVKSRPSLVTKDPAAVIPRADVIAVVVPSYAHAPVLQAILPFCRPNTFIVGLPAHAGFDFQFTHIFGSKAKECTLAVFETLPWACRIIEYGAHAQVLGTKERVGAALLQGENSNVPFDCIATLQQLIGDKPKLKMVQNSLVVNLMAKTMIHPPIMYGKWRNWDGKPVKQKPLFYQGMDDAQADLLTRVSDEVLLISQTVKDKCNKIVLDISPITHIQDWIKEYYGDQVKDGSSLKLSFQTNQAYNGLVHPLKDAEDGGYVPDFSYRYVREDVPFGLVVLKGIAEIVDVSTPAMDTVISWAQEKLGAEYIVGAELKGRDLSQTRAPQVFGIQTVDQLMLSN
ncbi:opine dehydrogenase-like [Mizuhopecten yessoensis]|uniref:Opine dehydrogenase n=1 Tax=Mizuhopecten yessoensis TaxID=6573 RepID=A0A210QRC5_MIZYE|nr:opine dehydrogenase-like [Mizuhopecten yessoensis]XP_021351933.1 opine dehydrogenase-like [Mizuhopecten yessoensis]XP_021351934.1 opine dehydrogenase-like [Mizuhopecten yessoensis]OWF51284.1 Opine dehydrogenase [Mizuhopecten yessoensis]